MNIRIRAGERPTLTINPRWNQRSQRRVWNAITTGWSQEPEKRCELSAMYRAFSTSSQLEQGDFNTRNEGDFTIAEA